MEKFIVTITETSKREVEIEAVSRAQAEEIVSDKWRNCDYVLDYGDFVEAEFKAKPAPKESVLARLDEGKKQAAVQTAQPRKANQHKGPEH